MDESLQNAFQFWKEKDQSTKPSSDSSHISKTVSSSVSTLVASLQGADASPSDQSLPGSRKLIHPPKRPPLPKTSDIGYSHKGTGNVSQYMKQEIEKHPVHAIKAYQISKKTSSRSLEGTRAAWNPPSPVQNDNIENSTHNVSELAKTLAPVLNSSQSLSHIDKTKDRFSIKVECSDIIPSIRCFKPPCRRQVLLH